MKKRYKQSSKIKLPRKRKKAYIKHYNRYKYYHTIAISKYIIECGLESSDTTRKQAMGFIDGFKFQSKVGYVPKFYW